MSPASTTARTEHVVGDKRAAILGAALELFVERGFHGAAVPLVAERAGVGAGTIYRYFRSKEDLVNALYQECKQEIATHVVAAIDPALPAREQFHRLWLRLIDYARRRPRAFAFLELHHHGSYLDDQSRAVEHRVIELSTAFLVRLQRDKVVKPIAPAILMAIVYWGFVGVVRCAGEGHLELDDLTVAQAEHCVWEAIRA